MSGDTNNEKSSVDQILDLLLDALQERQAERTTVAEHSNGVIEAHEEDLVEEVIDSAESPQPTSQPEDPSPEPSPILDEADVQPLLVIESVEEPESELAAEPILPPEPPPLQPSINLNGMLVKMVLGLLFVVFIINGPLRFSSISTAIANLMPDAETTVSLAVRDGLLLQGNGREVYVMEQNLRRWITTKEAFEFYGYDWGDVNKVDPTFLEKFNEGKPIHVLAKCPGSPHIYALEPNKKRWIKDITTFNAQGYTWSDVITDYDCNVLRRMAQGAPIPADAGTPPQP